MLDNSISVQWKVVDYFERDLVDRKNRVVNILSIIVEGNSVYEIYILLTNEIKISTVYMYFYYFDDQQKLMIKIKCE